jgi:hypothetical protein
VDAAVEHPSNAIHKKDMARVALCKSCMERGHFLRIMFSVEYLQRRHSSWALSAWQGSPALQWQWSSQPIAHYKPDDTTDPTHFEGALRGTQIKVSLPIRNALVRHVVR